MPDGLMTFDKRLDENLMSQAIALQPLEGAAFERPVRFDPTLEQNANRRSPPVVLTLFLLDGAAFLVEFLRGRFALGLRW